MGNKITGVYLIKDENGDVSHIIFRDEKTGHKLVFKAEEVSLEELAELIIKEKDI